MLAVNGHVQLRSVCGNLIYNSRILFQVDSNEEYDIEKGGNERGIDDEPRTKEAEKNRISMLYLRNRKHVPCFYRVLVEFY